MDRSPRRIASPVNRTPSFEIAILTSPPLSPHHDLPPMEPSPISPDPPPLPPHSFSPRRKVHESIVREVRELQSRVPNPLRVFGQIRKRIEVSLCKHVTNKDTGTVKIISLLSLLYYFPCYDAFSVELPPYFEFFVFFLVDFLVKEVSYDEEDNVEETDQEIEFPVTEERSIDPEITEQPEEPERVEDEQQKSGDDNLDNRLTQQLEAPSDRRIIFPITPFYRRKGTCSKCSIWLGALCALFFLLSIALFLVWVITTDGFRTIGAKSTNVCNTRQCIDIAFRLSSCIDDEIEPCENFYRYSCQRYHSQTADKQMSFLSQLKDESLRRMHSLLSSEEDSRLLPKSARLSRSLYSACMNAVLRESDCHYLFKMFNFAEFFFQNLLSAFARDSLLRDPRDVQSQLDEVARLMVDLYISARQSASLTPNTTYMTIGEMFQALPQLYLREFLDAQLSNTYRWTETDMLSIQDYDYFARLSDIMAQTSRQAVANYLLTVTVWNLKQYSYSPRDQYGWRECVDQISSFEIGRKMYVDKASQTIDLPKIQEFLQNLKIDFLSVHRSTPLQYLSNINRLGFYVGFPRRLQNEELIWKPVSQVSLNETDYFDSMIRVGKAERDYTMSQIGTYLDNDDTTTFPISDPTMLYNSNVGAIVIPLAFIEPPIYLPGDEVPMYGIYSSLGITTLQMISKVFWQGLDKTSQLECLDNVFRGFLDANRQRSPNIEPELLATIELADAFKSALYSYAKWQNDHHIHHEKTLPAFDSTDSMRSLMLTFSTMFCSGEGSEPGSDYEAMINTVAENSRMFSIHFNCNNSSRLYNRRTCL
nr:hypothetical protein F45E4.7 - Caenorhabditis elegans [Caenorhabditis elegans]